MQDVAIAGGTGDVGRAILDEMQSSSSVKEPKVSEITAPAIIVDYHNVEETASALASNQVNVVICTFQVATQDASLAQVNLIKAAHRSGTVKRFVASEWAVHHTEISPLHELREAAMKELQKTQLEWTRFFNGYFMDYYGMPHVKSHLKPVSFLVDVENHVAGIPGTGEDTVAFAYTADLAKFVVAALRLPRWERTTYCYSDKATYNELVRLAEEARDTKVNITYDPIDTLEKGGVQELAAHSDSPTDGPREQPLSLYAVFSIYVATSHFHAPTEGNLNQIFPDITTTRLKDVVGAWKGK